MATLTSIGRPYAFAAFEYAREHNQLSEWNAFLKAAALTCKDPSVARLLGSKETLSSALYDLFHAVLSSITTPEQNNFLRLLAQNKRLAALPEIADMFDVYYASLQKISQVRVVTAIEMNEQYQQKLRDALAKRLHHEVTLQPEIDPDILGGAIIHIGDRVIDGSVRGKLTRLLEFSLR